MRKHVSPFVENDRHLQVRTRGDLVGRSARKEENGYLTEA
jgi:hypothetical protein